MARRKAEPAVPTPAPIEPVIAPVPGAPPRLGLLDRMTIAVSELSSAQQFGRAHAIETAALRLGELRNVLGPARDFAPAHLAASLQELIDLI